ncbi:type-2 restriction enzyme Sau3AI [Andreesenia angusta]|uniref:Type-2 restriction enzyme Sau3AI n=1 Tax=Andreesenia angusta TaxID=39480 RepID=A0A1S1V3N5_9FIRM|nr:type-2 restriction enzyme Sau3AI [Andreesenia angusta]
MLNIIDFNKIVHEDFFNSSFYHKNKLLLLIWYFHDILASNPLDYSIDYVKLFKYPEEDLKIITQDWEKIVRKIRNGKAHELSEGDTMYLGACTKGSTAAKSMRKQPNSDILAPQRAFSLKGSYMTSILRNYILNDIGTYESIVKDPSALEEYSFEEYVKSEIRKHRGRSLDELMTEFNINPKSKDRTSRVALKILGVESKNASEFEKANIKVKAIRIEYNGKIKEHMSFPTFKFKDLVNESWEESEFRTMLSETRFFFVIYKKDKNGNLILDKEMFWNMPIGILDTEVKKVWKEAKQIIKDGVVLTQKGKRTFNNLPSPSENPVSHVRPHAQNSEDTYPLPDGRKMPKQCFWLNNSFILEQISLQEED